MTGFVKKIGALVGMLVWQTVLAKQLVHNAIPKGVECTPEKVGDDSLFIVVHPVACSSLLVASYFVRDTSLHSIF